MRRWRGRSPSAWCARRLVVAAAATLQGCERSVRFTACMPPCPPTCSLGRPAAAQLGHLPQVSTLCRDQLKRVEVERSDDVRLDRHLWGACSRDMHRYCQGVDPGGLGRALWRAGAAAGLSLAGRAARRCRCPDPPPPGYPSRCCVDLDLATLADEGRLEGCLQDHREEEGFSDRCREAVEARLERASADYELNYGLRRGGRGRGSGRVCVMMMLI